MAKAGLSDAFEIASAATSREELGNSVLSAPRGGNWQARHFPAQAKLPAR